MKHVRLVGLVLAGSILAGTACTYQSRDPVQPAETPVGMVTRAFVDTSRQNWDGTAPRPIRTSIWYPSIPAALQTAILDSSVPFTVPNVASGGPVAASVHKYPLVLMSHGTGGSAIQMMWLGHDLASHGYIVAAVNHHGNTGAEPRRAAQGFLLYWERARDLRVALDLMLADSVFAGAIDTARIAAVGFSLGGYTVLSVAGGRFNQRQYDTFCASAERDFTCGPQLEFPEAPALFASLRLTDARVQESLRHSGDSYRDSRVKAVLAIAPALGGGFVRTDFSDVSIPVRIIVGAGDTIAAPATNAARYASLIPGARLTVLPGAIGHYTFLAECTATGKSLMPICRDGEGVDRREVHARVARLTLEFLAVSLTGGRT